MYLVGLRYNLGRCKEEEWQELNNYLSMLDKDKRSVVGAVSNYDIEYLRHCYIFSIVLEKRE